MHKVKVNWRPLSWIVIWLPTYPHSFDHYTSGASPAGLGAMCDNVTGNVEKGGWGWDWSGSLPACNGCGNDILPVFRAELSKILQLLKRQSWQNKDWWKIVWSYSMVPIFIPQKVDCSDDPFLSLTNTQEGEPDSTASGVSWCLWSLCSVHQ